VIFDYSHVFRSGASLMISQLADGTALFLEANEKSFNACMSLLENFAINISGLKINYSKTLDIEISLNEDSQVIKISQDYIS
jgi:hypothetical protein